MRVIIISVFLFIFGCKAGAQSGAGRLKGLDTTNAPLVMVDTFATDMRYLILDVNKIASIDVYKDTAAINKFGQRATNGVVVIRTKEKINFLRLKDIFDKFNFPVADRNLRVCIDEVLVSRPGLILADDKEINSINTFNVVNWDNIRAPVHEKFINIPWKKDKTP